MAENGVHGIVFERIGSGEPLMLIHGTGSSREVWEPVVPRLRERHELLLVDLPGHGGSDLPPAGVEPTPIGFARLLSDLIEALGFERVHAAGSSVGGWTSLELAKLGGARSVTAIGPAGLWNPRGPRSAELSLWLSNRSSRAFGRLLPYAFATSPGRTLFLGQQFGRPWQVDPAKAVEAARGMGRTRGFDEHLRATNRVRFEGGDAIDVPVTIAFGTRERLLPKRSGRLRDELPDQARWVDLPRCGHLAMWDAPDLVARTILETTGATSPAAS